MTGHAVSSAAMSRPPATPPPEERLGKDELARVRAEIAERCRRAARARGLTNEQINALAGRPKPWADRAMYAGPQRAGLGSLLLFAAAVGVHVADLLAEPSYSTLVPSARPTPISRFDEEAERRKVAGRARTIMAERCLSMSEVEEDAGHPKSWLCSIVDAATCGVDALIEFAEATGILVADLFTEGPSYTEALALSEGAKPWRLEVSDELSIAVWATSREGALEALECSDFSGVRGKLKRWPSDEPAPAWAGVPVPMPDLPELERRLLADIARYEDGPRKRAGHAETAAALESLAARGLLDPKEAARLAPKSTAYTWAITDRHREAVEVRDRLRAELGKEPSMEMIGKAMEPVVTTQGARHLTKQRVSVLLRQADGKS
jgi:hypothetical protein